MKRKLPMKNLFSGLAVGALFLSLNLNVSAQTTGAAPKAGTNRQPFAGAANATPNPSRIEDSKASRLLVRLKDKEQLKNARTTLASIDKCVLAGYIGIKDAFLVYALTTDKFELTGIKQNVQNAFSNKVEIEEVSAEEVQRLRMLSTEMYKKKLQESPTQPQPFTPDNAPKKEESK